MLDADHDLPRDDEDVEFAIAGARAAGEYRCADCGYGVTVHGELPLCPMCTGDAWEQAAWSPLSRAFELR